MYGYIEMQLGDRPTKWMCLRKRKSPCGTQWFAMVLKSFITQSMSHAGFLFFIFIFPTNTKFGPLFSLTDPQGVAYYYNQLRDQPTCYLRAHQLIFWRK